MITTFTLDDVVIGRTWMEGRGTSGGRRSGIVQRVVPGVGFHVDNGYQPSILWGEFAIRSATGVQSPRSAEGDYSIRPEHSLEEGEIPTAPPAGDDACTPLPPPPALRRTDSGADYGMPGFPDCEWWEAHGVAAPPFVVTVEGYYGGPMDPAHVRDVLATVTPPEEGTAAWRAWQRQTAPDTPTASPAASPVCPPAPRRPAMDADEDDDATDIPVMRPLPASPEVTVPSLHEHRGRGILPGDFIKPDPAMTRQETRRYVIAELHRWLEESSIASHARAIAAVTTEPAALAPLVAAGRWPAARLYLVLAGLEAMPLLPQGRDGRPLRLVDLPLDYEERFQWVARWAASVCEDHLRGYEPVIPAARMAVGFVTEDLLPDGFTTIASFWNYSPFERLRNAPPLPDPPAEAEAEAEAEPWAVTDLLNAKITLRFTGAQGLTGLVAVVAYLWLVAFVINACR